MASAAVSPTTFGSCDARCAGRDDERDGRPARDTRPLFGVCPTTMPCGFAAARVTTVEVRFCCRSSNCAACFRRPITRGTVTFDALPPFERSRTAKK